MRITYMTLDKRTRTLIQDPDKRRAWIIYQVSLQGRSLAQVAAEAGVSRQCLYQVFHRRYPRMERVLAAALNVAVEILWPERYDADGLPLNGRRLQHSIRRDRRTMHSRQNYMDERHEPRGTAKIRAGAGGT